MSAFDQDTRLQPSGDQAWSGHVSPAWNIGANPNGGYLLALAARALREALPTHPDPLSVTVHYLRPGLSDQPCRIDTRILRTGRSLATARATLMQDDTPRLEVLAALGDLGKVGEPMLAPAAPLLPEPDRCMPRSGEGQAIALPIVDRVDVRLDPATSAAGGPPRAEVAGWIRLRDGRAPDALASLLFVDAFPPAVFGLLGPVGWVPTVSLTVQLRRRPGPGWMMARFRTEDLQDGRLLEDGTLWDGQGHLVAQSRQLALLLPPGSGR